MINQMMRILASMTDQQLVDAAQQGNGQIPTSFIMSELSRRKELRSAQNAQQPTEVAPQVAQAIQGQDPYGDQQAMAGGGIVAFREGGDVRRFATAGEVNQNGQPAPNYNSVVDRLGLRGALDTVAGAGNAVSRWWDATFPHKGVAQQAPYNMHGMSTDNTPVYFLPTPTPSGMVDVPSSTDPDVAASRASGNSFTVASVSPNVPAKVAVAPAAAPAPVKKAATPASEVAGAPAVRREPTPESATLKPPAAPAASAQAVYNPVDYAAPTEDDAVTRHRLLEDQIGRDHATPELEQMQAAARAKLADDKKNSGWDALLDFAANVDTSSPYLLSGLHAGVKGAIAGTKKRESEADATEAGLRAAHLANTARLDAQRQALGIASVDAMDKAQASRQAMDIANATGAAHASGINAQVAGQLQAAHIAADAHLRAAREALTKGAITEDKALLAARAGVIKTELDAAAKRVQTPGLIGLDLENAKADYAQALQTAREFNTYVGSRLGMPTSNGKSQVTRRP